MSKLVVSCPQKATIFLFWVLSWTFCAVLICTFSFPCHPSVSFQVVSSVSTARGESRASWPCPVPWGITFWRTWTWSFPIPTLCPSTWTSCSLSSWSWHRTVCGTPSATRRRSASSGNGWTSHISAPRASSSSPSTAVALTTSRSWWSSLKARTMKRSDLSHTHTHTIYTFLKWSSDNKKIF